jgi:hypothetical protein
MIFLFVFVCLSCDFFIEDFSNLICFNCYFVLYFLLDGHDFRLFCLLFNLNFFINLGSLFSCDSQFFSTGFFHFFKVSLNQSLHFRTI